MNINTWKCLRIGLSASLFSFYNLIIFSLMNVLGVYLIRDLHLQAATLGFLASWYLWGNVIGFIPIGILLDHYSVRRVGITLFSIAILATIAFSYATSLWLLCLLRFMQGLASAASLLILMRIGTTLVPKHSNKMIGFMIFIALSGGIAGNILFSALADSLGWRCALLMIAAIGVICLLIMICCLHFEDTRIKQIQMKILFSRHSILAGLQIGILSAPVFVLASLFGNQYLMHQYGVSLNQASVLSSLIFIGIMSGAPVVGLLADSMSSMKLLTLGYLVLIILTAVLTLNLAIPYFMLALIFIGLGIASCTQNLIYPIIYQRHPEARSTATGVASLVSNGIGAMLQVSVGLLTQYLSLQGTAIFMFMLSLYFLGCLTCCRLRK